MRHELPATDTAAPSEPDPAQWELFASALPPAFLAAAGGGQRRGRDRPWWGIAALLLPLLAALVLVERWPVLAADAAWRPRLERACIWLGCELPPWREPSALRVTASSVRPHPSVPGALLITGSFRNDAAFAQAWPRLEVVLTDLRGSAIGARVFDPEEYLDVPPMQPLFASGRSARIAIAVLDPGEETVAFSLDFR